MKDFKPFKLPPSLKETYVHSNIAPFINSLDINNLETKAISTFDTVKTNLLEKIEERRDLLRSLENEYAKVKFGTDRDSALNKMNNFYSEKYKWDGKFTDPNVLSVISQIRSTWFDKKGTNKGQPNRMEKYNQKFQKVKELLSNTQLLYKNLIDENGKNSDYKNTFNEIEKLKKDLDIVINIKPTEENSKVYGEYFKKIHKEGILRIVGFLFEVGFQKMMEDLGLKISTSNENTLFGTKGFNSKFVADILLSNNIKEKKVGVNIKSAEKKYSITRVNQMDSETLTKDFYNSIDYKYMARNVTGFKNFYVNYIKTRDEYNKIEKIFNTFYNIESSILFLSNFNSVFDGFMSDVDEERNLNMTHSILIFYQGGFLWTSDVITAIFESVKSVANNYNTKLKGKSSNITYTTARNLSDVDSKSFYRNRYNQKRKAIREKKKEIQKSSKTLEIARRNLSKANEIGNLKQKNLALEKIKENEPIVNTDIYDFLSKNPAISPITQKKDLLVKHIVYEIKLENIKNLIQKNRGS